MKDIYKLEILKNKLNINRFYINLFFIILIIGIFTNFIALYSNGFKMPVKTDKEFITSSHFNYNNFNEVNLSRFTDIIKIKNHILSIGDILIYISLIYIIIIITHTTYIHIKIMSILKEKQKQIKLKEKYNGRTNRF